MATQTTKCDGCHSNLPFDKSGEIHIDGLKQEVMACTSFGFMLSLPCPKGHSCRITWLRGARRWFHSERSHRSE